MGTGEDIAHLLSTAAASMKGDVKGALAKLDSAYALARESGEPETVAHVAEELARGWSRRKSPARSLYYAHKATKVATERKAAWTTLAKTCELVASRVQGAHKQGRARALFRACAAAYKKAAALTKDAEDRRWLLEFAGDAAREAKKGS